MHMTNNLDFFEVIDQTKTDKISIANGTVIDADGVGNGCLNCTLDDGTIHRIKVEKVLYNINRKFVVSEEINQ